MSGIALQELMTGALAMGYLVAATFFLRFWRQTGDRLFGIFALAFAMLAVQRIALAMVDPARADEGLTHLYLIRLAAFVCILGAIIDRNRRPRSP